RVQITLVGRTADLGSAGQVHHGSTQWLPSALSFVVGHATVGLHTGLRRHTLWGLSILVARVLEQRARRLRCGLGAEHGEGFGAIDGVFNPQEVGEFVVGLLAVEASQMFDADPLMPCDDVTADITVETSVYAAGFEWDMVPQETHHVRAAKSAQAVDDEGWINSSQLVLVIKDQVGGVFALSYGPVVEEMGKR